MKSRFFLNLIAACGLAPLAFGSVYVPNFNGSLIGDPVDGVDGWVQSEPNNDPISPLAWVSDHYGQNAGTIGAYYDTPDPLGSSYYIGRSIGVPLVGSTLQLRFGVQDSTTDFPELNDFYIQVANGTGLNLFSLVFAATSGLGNDDPLAPNDPGTSNSQWDMNWTTGASSDSPFGGIVEDGSYTMDLSFVQNGLDVDFTLLIDGPLNDFTETGTLTGLSAESFSQLRIGTNMGGGADWGDNFFAFTAIPEPTSAVLLGLGSLALLRRRRL